MCDPTARSFDPVVRSALAEYLQILKGASGNGSNGTRENKRVKIYNVPELVEDSIKVIDEYWTDYILSQGLMEGQRYVELTGFMQNVEKRNEMNALLKSIGSPEARLQKFEHFMRKEVKYGQRELNEIKLQFCYSLLVKNIKFIEKTIQ